MGVAGGCRSGCWGFGFGGFGGAGIAGGERSLNELDVDLGECDA